MARRTVSTPAVIGALIMMLSAAGVAAAQLRSTAKAFLPKCGLYFCGQDSDCSDLLIPHCTQCGPDGHCAIPPEAER
jgi:hypothetical protein